MIKENDIPASILAFAIAHNGLVDHNVMQEDGTHGTLKNSKKLPEILCPLNMTSLKDGIVSLRPDPEMVNEAYSKVKVGGRWRPDNCVPQIKST